MYNNPDELMMFLMEQTALQQRRARPPMPTPFPMGMQAGMGYAPPSFQGGVSQQIPTQWPQPAKLPSIRQFMRPSGGDFQSWYADRAAKMGLDPNPDDQQHFYDYRGAHAAGAEPDAQGHWPSQFKTEGHPRMVLDGVNTKTGVNYPAANAALTQGTPRGHGGMNPMSMALLAAGMRMLQASGPSTQRTSLGQVLGAGGMEGLNTYAQQRHQQFQEGQMAENSELRREQIESMRGMREAQAGELASKAEERQRIQSLMPEYQAAVASGNQDAVRAVVSKMYPEKYAEAALKDPEKNAQIITEATGDTINGKPAYQDHVVIGRNPDGTPKTVPFGKPHPKGAANEIHVGVDARKYDETAGTERAKTAQTMQKDALKAVTHANTIEMLADALEGYSGGPLAEFQAKIGRIFPESEYGKIASIDDAAQAIIGRSYSQVRAEGTGATSDFEAKGFIKAFPSLAKTPQGREFIKRFGRRMAEREAIASDIYAELADKGTVKLREWMARVDKEAGPYFTKDEWKQIRALESGVVPSGKPWERKW